MLHLTVQRDDDDIAIIGNPVKVTRLIVLAILRANFESHRMEESIRLGELCSQNFSLAVSNIGREEDQMRRQYRRTISQLLALLAQVRGLFKGKPGEPREFDMCAGERSGKWPRKKGNG